MTVLELIKEDYINSPNGILAIDIEFYKYPRLNNDDIFIFKIVIYRVSQFYNNSIFTDLLYNMVCGRYECLPKKFNGFYVNNDCDTVSYEIDAIYNINEINRILNVHYPEATATIQIKTFEFSKTCENIEDNLEAMFDITYNKGMTYDSLIIIAFIDFESLLINSIIITKPNKLSNSIAYVLNSTSNVLQIYIFDILNDKDQAYELYQYMQDNLIGKSFQHLVDFYNINPFKDSNKRDIKLDDLRLEDE